jgi:hypothetical protein
MTTQNFKLILITLSDEQQNLTSIFTESHPCISFTFSLINGTATSVGKMGRSKSSSEQLTLKLPTHSQKGH